MNTHNIPQLFARGPGNCSVRPENRVFFDDLHFDIFAHCAILRFLILEFGIF